MRCFVMLVTAVCVLFLLKLKWPKNKSSNEVRSVLPKEKEKEKAGIFVDWLVLILNSVRKQGKALGLRDIYNYDTSPSRTQSVRGYVAQKGR